MSQEWPESILLIMQLFIYFFKKSQNNLTAILPEPRFELEKFLERVGKTFKFMLF